MIQRKLFTTENTKDTEKIIPLTQHIRISVSSVFSVVILLNRILSQPLQLGNHCIHGFRTFRGPITVFKMMKRIALITLIVLLIIPVGLLGLMGSATGSLWLVETVFSHLPEQVSVKSVEGRLLERMVFSDLYYKSDTETVTVKKLVLAWRPFELFSGTLKIVDLTLNDVNVNVTKTAPPEKTTFDVNAELRLPVQVVIENLLLTRSYVPAR